MNIIGGFILIIIGIFVVIKTEVLLGSFGKISFFEKYLNTEGGSRLGYKIIGLLTIFIGMLIITGMINDFLSWILSPILKHTLVN